MEFWRETPIYLVSFTIVMSGWYFLRARHQRHTNVKRPDLREHLNPLLPLIGGLYVFDLLFDLLGWGEGGGPAFILGFAFMLTAIGYTQDYLRYRIAQRQAEGEPSRSA